MSSLLEFNRVYYSLEIQSDMLVFFDPALWTIAPLTFSPPLPLFPSQNTIYTDCVWLGGGGGGGVWSCVGDHILQEFNPLFHTRFRTYNIALPPQKKI